MTEMLAEPTAARKLEPAHEIAAIHAHPTMNRGDGRPQKAALGAAIHL